MRQTAMIALSLLAAGIVAGSEAFAQDSAASYPSKPVTIVSPFAPGGTTDKGGRLYAQKLTESLGKPFLMDFKPSD